MRRLCRNTPRNFALFALCTAMPALVTAAGQELSPSSGWDQSLSPQSSQSRVGRAPRPVAGGHLVTVHDLSHVVPKKARVEYARAEKARGENRIADAIQHFERAISIDPDFVEARNNLAVSYYMVAKPGAGVAQLEEAIRIDPHKSMLFMNLALGYSGLDQLDAAERAARKAVDLDPSGAPPHLVLGFVLTQQQKYTDEAILCLESTQGRYPLAELLLARVLLSRGDLSRAKSHVESYVSSGDPEYRQSAQNWLDKVNAATP